MPPISPTAVRVWRRSQGACRAGSIQLVADRARQEDHLAAIRRERGIEVVPFEAGQSFGAPPVAATRLDVAAARRPRRVDDRAAIGRPGRHELAFGGCSGAGCQRAGQQARRAVRQVRDVEPVHRAEDDARSVRGERGPADQPRAHAFAVVHAHRRVDSRARSRPATGTVIGMGARHRFRSRRAAACRRRHDQRLAVGHEGVARAACRGWRATPGRRASPGSTSQRSAPVSRLRTRRPVSRLVARAVDEALAVGRDHRSHGAALGVGHLRRHRRSRDRGGRSATAGTARCR